MSVAGVVLTLNEERSLARALSSLQWCDELIVLDSGSSDNTRAIALSSGARFYQHVQPPPFLITNQRNWAIDNCQIKSDWVLFLDADEQVGLVLKEAICFTLSHANNINAFYLSPRYWFFGMWLRRTQNYPNWHPRLIRTGQVRFEGGVWESFGSSAISSKIKEPYEHYPFSKGFDHWINTHLRYADEEATQIYHNLYTPNKITKLSSRRKTKRLVALYLWPLRPLLKFLDKYIISLGFLEGWQSLLFSLLMSFYELMVIVKVLERLVTIDRKSK